MVVGHSVPGLSNDCSHTLGISCNKPSKPSATAEGLPAVNCCYKEFQYRCYRVGVMVPRSASENLSCFLKRYAKSFVYTQFYSHFTSAYFSTYSNVGNAVVSNARAVAQNFMLFPVQFFLILFTKMFTQRIVKGCVKSIVKMEFARKRKITSIHL